MCAQDAAYVALLHPGSDSTNPELQVMVLGGEGRADEVVVEEVEVENKVVVVVCFTVLGGIAMAATALTL